MLGAVGGLRNPEVTDVLFVVNGNRPFRRGRPDIVKMLREVEVASKLRVNGLVANTHLLGETTPGVITVGLELAGAVSQELGLPVRFWAALDTMAIDCWQGADGREWPKLALKRRITPPTDKLPPGGRRRSSVL